MVACGGDSGGADGGLDAGRDASVVDGGGRDAGLRDAAFEDAAADASLRDAAMTDAGRLPDAGMRPDAGPPPLCDERFGAFCEDTGTCPAGFECDIGRCGPQARPECGGFAGWTCPRTPGSPFTECLYYTGADFGVCVTPAERDCLCRTAPENVACP